MDAPIKPKLKPHSPHPTPEQKENVLKPVAELVISELETGEAPGLDYLASADGLGLLVEVAKFAGELVETRQAPVRHVVSEPVDPRRCVDPRKKILPR